MEIKEVLHDLSSRSKHENTRPEIVYLFSELIRELGEDMDKNLVTLRLNRKRGWSQALWQT